MQNDSLPGHALHRIDCSSSAYFPGAQGKHSMDPNSVAYRPVAQGCLNVSPRQKCPGLHLRIVLFQKYDPGGIALHVIDPLISLLKPLGHA